MPGAHCSGIKRLKLEADPLPSTGLRMCGTILTTPRTVSWHGSSLGRLTITLFLLSGNELHVELKSNLKCAQRGRVTENCLITAYEDRTGGCDVI
jgi:hypothetical protein